MNPFVHSRWIRLSALLISLVLTGCVRFTDLDQTALTPGAVAILAPGRVVGQTFVARHGGLNGVEVYLSPTPNAYGTIVFHLRESPISAVDILTTTIYLQTGAKGELYRFYFPPILLSHTHYYYFFLEMHGSGSVEVPIGPWSSYPDGALYENHQPRPSQAVFRLSYHPFFIILDLSLMIFWWIIYGLLVILVLFFPGYWIVARWVREMEDDFTVTVIFSVIAALAAWMVILVWISVLGIRLTTWSVAILVGISAIFGFMRWMNDRHWWWRRDFWLGRQWSATLAFWIIVIFSIGLRLFVGRGLVMLPGSDTYHHALIVQLFQDQGGIPYSYEPYAPLLSFSYHFGFHSIVALFRWLLGTELLAATKNAALVLNGGIAATAGLLSERLSGSRRAGFITAAIIGLIAVSPFCLLRWGRFTQTTGLLFLCAALAVLVRIKKADLIISSLLVAGTLLSHYRIAFFLMVFVLLMMGIHWLGRRDGRITTQVVILAMALFLTVPWLARVAWIQLDPHGLRLTYSLLPGFNDLSRLQDVLSFPTNLPLLLLAIIAVAWGWLTGRCKAEMCTILAWALISIGIALAGDPSWDLKTAILSSAVPTAVLLGIGGSLIWRMESQREEIWARRFINLILLGGIFIGILRFPSLIYTGRFYLRPSDLLAMEWIKHHIPAFALFFVDAVEFEWSPGWMVGTDAGYWIPLLTHRASTLPPMLYPLEWGDLPQLAERVTLMQYVLLGHGNSNKPLSQTLASYGVTHIMVSHEHGLMNPSVWSSDPGLVVIYQYDRGQILGVQRAAYK